MKRKCHHGVNVDFATCMVCVREEHERFKLTLMEIASGCSCGFRNIARRALDTCEGKGTGDE